MKQYHIVVVKNDAWGIYDVQADNKEDAGKKAINLFWRDINGGMSVRIHSIDEVDATGAPVGV